MAHQNTPTMNPIPLAQARRGRGVGGPSRGQDRQVAPTRGLGASSTSRIARLGRNNQVAPSKGSFFTGANDLDINGGQFNMTRGHHTNLTINLNQGGYVDIDEAELRGDEERQQANNVSVRTPEQAIRVPDEQQRPWRRPSLPVQKSCDIYYRHLSVKGRGSPLWVPEPNTKLPLQYQRRGISIGDVGIITDYGGFDFLFNICLPRDDPNNAEDVPENFVPLKPPLRPSDVRGHSGFRPNSYLSSGSVERSRRDSDPSGLTFETTESEGAILTMPQGSKSEDLGSVIRFRKYMSANAEDWYRYVHDVRGREARNGDVRLVVGWDQTTTWGMATFAKTTAQNGFRLKFRPMGESSVGRTYGWEYSGMAEVRAGPDIREIEELRANDPSQDGIVYDNQCLFIRTLNATLDNDIWDKLVSETDMSYVQHDRSTFDSYAPSSFHPSNPSGSTTGGSTSNPGGQSGARGASRLTDTLSPASTGSVHVSDLPTALANHPSKVINEMLLKERPNARMAITEDKDWISVISQDDLVLPPADQLFARILRSHHVCEEEGVVFLDAKQKIEAIAENVEGLNMGSVVTSTSAISQIINEMETMANENNQKTLKTMESARLGLSSFSSSDDNNPQSSWQKGAKQRTNVRPEYTKAMLYAHKAVAQAIWSTVGKKTADLSLIITADLSGRDRSPVPGLRKSGEILFNIWNAVQDIDMHTLAFIHLTDRCATLLLAVREEFSEAGIVPEGLAAPIESLEESFSCVHRLMIKQNNRPWLKKYLKRNETLREISTCNNRLHNTLSFFGAGIQVRILRAEIDQQAELREMKATLNTNLLALRTSEISDGHELTLVETAAQSESITSVSSLGQDFQILPDLESLQAQQNSFDASQDLSELRDFIYPSVQDSDEKILEVLQVGRPELADAIVAMQRALDRPPEGNGGAAADVVLVSSLGLKNYGVSRGETKNPMDLAFIEAGLDSLKRIRGLDASVVPTWTITKFEVDRDEKVSAGFFSDVYSGTWQGQTVAIKVLAESIPTQLFLREMQTWTTLQHPNVLRVYGGSSGADDPPLFFVTPYMKNGSLVQYLKWIEADTQPNTPAGTRLQSTMTSKAHSSLQKSSSQVDSNRPDLTRFMHEIAKGMEYLHNKGVLHGDLRAVNVLVDDDLACRISDFGQNEMKSEAVRTSGLLPPIGGTLRWQSPEYMSGASPLTPEVDVWAFSITCVEILTMGRIPWPLEDDDTVRDLVLKGNLHPPLPKNLPFNIPPALLDILNNCWCVAPEDRLPFQRVTAALHSLRNSIRYNSLKSTPPFFHAAMPGSEPKRVQSAQAALRKLVSEDQKVPRRSSTSMSSDEGVDGKDDNDEATSPADEAIWDAKNERRYRLLLTHEYHLSLILPLWEPSAVDLGAVGYLQKPGGKFITLFNAFHPEKSDLHSIQSLPSIHGYGPVQIGLQHPNKKSLAKRALEMLKGTASSANSFRQSFPLRAGHKVAYIYAEGTEYRYMETLDPAKKWFRSNVGTILQTYGDEHHIQKEELFLVIGTLHAPDYALYVSHSHPDGQLYFNVNSNRKQGQHWGTFTADGDENEQPRLSASKVSNYGGPSNAVLLARLRFKPDTVDLLDPTSR